MKGYVYLTTAVLAEVFASAMLKMTEGFTVLFPSLAVVSGYAISFYCLGLCLKTLPLSLAYGVWAGMGTALIAIVSGIVWGEAFGDIKFVGIVLIIGGVILLNTKSVERAREPSS
ncbi:MAG TPA: multidrug efflux SMR transporter [Virgibacillus sp.]|nr:multidrug efflux SMR transporter [Virgibacillus sp.]